MTSALSYRARFHCLLAVVAVLWAGLLSGQRSVNLLGGVGERAAPTLVNPRASAASEAFVLDRNLIFFEASVNGAPGSFILDTGAPTLVVNNRGGGDNDSRFTGLGAGGQVSLTDHRVDHFEMLDRSVDNYWAIGVDLRDMEIRTGKRIDGFVGYDLLNEGELRIDYHKQTFQLLASQRRPRHDGQLPRASLRFALADHLPVIELKIDGKRYRFAIDTGAGLNLLADWAAEKLAAEVVGASVNVQGLDGRAVDCPSVQLSMSEHFPGDEALQFVTTDLSHLQEAGDLPLAGILGSSFLSQYTVGIDYRRQKMHLW
ncbi:hypothetical protein GGR26_000926 [Lewinella marina]|uniref:Aspartyl protease n=1 Tax=Neolewinella marina TaxID=438751 RepID=A0A2G0CI91_9BACT|nr:pepsin/retropepsin-like aspartic protease family protein [Neolewinella marina]NJB85181.1 hypothetical protein [Neolewinella marina]PHK99686.1 hypothetical protein CGL56_01150 [Neolewinella marina]